MLFAVIVSFKLLQILCYSSQHLRHLFIFIPGVLLCSAFVFCCCFLVYCAFIFHSLDGWWLGVCTYVICVCMLSLPNWICLWPKWHDTCFYSMYLYRGILHYIRKLHDKIPISHDDTCFLLLVRVLDCERRGRYPSALTFFCIVPAAIYNPYPYTYILQHTSVTMFSSRFILIRRWVVSCILEFQSWFLTPH